MRKGFTLIEVMVAVLIISVVIATLMQMRGNSTHIFLELDKKSKINQFSSFFIANNKYGFENKNTSLDELISDYVVEDDLGRELRNTKVNVIYQKIDTIDMSEFGMGASSDSEDDENTNTATSTMVFEIGKSILKTKDSSSAILRLRLQQ